MLQPLPPFSRFFAEDIKRPAAHHEAKDTLNKSLTKIPPKRNKIENPLQRRCSRKQNQHEPRLLELHRVRKATIAHQRVPHVLLSYTSYEGEGRSFTFLDDVLDVPNGSQGTENAGMSLMQKWQKT